MEQSATTPDVGDEALERQVARLFEQYHEAIFAYLYRLLGEAGWAEDLTQETFLRLYRTRGRLAAVENERAWVYRIAANLAYTALKRRHRFAWLPWIEGDSLRAGHLAPDDPARQAPEQLAVARALAQLAPTYRAPLLLYSHFDFSVREVAEILDLSEAAVKTRLYRAREMFRVAYEA